MTDNHHTPEQRERMRRELRRRDVWLKAHVTDPTTMDWQAAFMKWIRMPPVEEPSDDGIRATADAA